MRLLRAHHERTEALTAKTPAKAAKKPRISAKAASAAKVVEPAKPRRAARPAKPKISAPLKSILASLDNAKAEAIVTIDLAGRSPLADQMVIATGRSDRHVSSIAERVMQDLKQAKLAEPRAEGMQKADWVLIDAGDVIVHVFRPEVRAFYNLEKLWGGDRPLELQAG